MSAKLEPIHTVKINWKNGAETTEKVAVAAFPAFVQSLDMDQIDKLDANPYGE